MYSTLKRSSDEQCRVDFYLSRLLAVYRRYLRLNMQPLHGYSLPFPGNAIQKDRHEPEILGRSLFRSFQAAGSPAIHPAMRSLHRRQMVWPRYRQLLPLSPGHNSMFSPFTSNGVLGHESYALSVLISFWICDSISYVESYKVAHLGSCIPPSSEGM